MSAGDSQALRDMSHFLRSLLARADVLPESLVALLREYEGELRYAQPWKLDGIGEDYECEWIANLVAQKITDGEWGDAVPLDDPARNVYARVYAPRSFDRALRLLHARGEVVMTGGRYYVRPRDAGS